MFRLTNKAAMFGLDARIALAIFGALSLISGAALYNAIKDAKVTRYTVEIQEIIKAIEAVHLDVGYFPTVNEYSKNLYDLRYLYTNPGNLANWKGPYVSSGKYSSTLSTTKSYQVINNILLGHRIGVPNSTACSSFTNSATNHLLIFYNPVDDALNCEFEESLAKGIHDKLENDGDYTAGNIVVPKANSSGETTVQYKINFLPLPAQS